MLRGMAVVCLTWRWWEGPFGTQGVEVSGHRCSQTPGRAARTRQRSEQVRTTPLFRETGWVVTVASPPVR